MTERKPILLFDLDNTILDFNTAEAAAMSKMLAARGIEPTEERLKLYNLINRQHWEKMEEGKLDRKGVLYGRFRAFFEALGLEEDAVSAQDCYEENLCMGHYFMPGAEKLLETLHNGGKYDMYIISNGNSKVQDARLKSSGISKYFNKIFISENMGCDKPSRAFFDLCFAEIPAFDASRALIIGDSLTSDIRGGINCGVKTCWYNPQSDPPRADIPADYTVKSLEEIPALLKYLYK